MTTSILTRLAAVGCIALAASCATHRKPKSAPKPAPVAAQPAPAVAAPASTPTSSPTLPPSPPPPATTINDYSAILDQDAKPQTIEKAKISTLFYTIGKAYKVNFHVDPTIADNGYLRFSGGTLRQLVENLVSQNDLYMEVYPGYIDIRRMREEIFTIDFPDINRTANSNTSVTLSPSTGASLSGAGNVSVIGSSANNNQQNSGQGGSDQTNLTINEKGNEEGYWAALTKSLKDEALPEEHITVRPFAGTITITASPRRLREHWRQTIAAENDRVTAQVLVEVRLDEFTLSDERQIGVDWTQIKTSIDKAVNIGPISTSTGFTNVSGNVLPSSTLLGNFSTGKLSAALTALQEQGTLRSLTRPSIRLLNNQKGFVKVGNDRSFFSLSTSTVIVGGATGSSVVTTPSYTKERQTFGVIMPVTAQISRNGYVTLVLEPARTRLEGVDTSPDGKSESPNTADQRISTMLRLRDGESAILGGLTQETSAHTNRGLPLLGKIPFVRALTSTDGTVKSVSDLLLTVSVKIIK